MCLYITDVILTFSHFHPLFSSSSWLLPGARTLFKFMKKFEAVLSEPCRPSLMESNTEEQSDFLVQPTEAATGEASPIQNLNKALRETLLTRPAAVQVLACGVVSAYSGMVRWDLCFLCKEHS